MMPSATGGKQQPSKKVLGDATNSKTISKQAVKCATSKKSKQKKKAQKNSRSNSSSNSNSNSSSRSNGTNTVNKAATSANSKQLDKQKEETKLRSYIQEFYESTQKSAAAFCKSKGVSYNKFNDQWTQSKLKTLKKAKNPPPSSEAMKQYDEWKKKTAENQRIQNIANASSKNKSTTGFVIPIDDQLNTEASPNRVITNTAAAAVAAASANIIDSTTSNNVTTNIAISGGSTENILDGDDDGLSVDNEPNPNETNDCDIQSGDSLEHLKKNTKTKKLSAKDMRDILLEFYVIKDETKLTTFMKNKNVLPHQKGIRNHWDSSKLNEMKAKSVCVKEAFKTYDKWLAVEKQKVAIKNKKNGSKSEAIPEEVKKLMYELIKYMAIIGQGLTRKVVEKMLKEALDEQNCFSRCTLDRFLAAYDLKCKSVKNIDPARIGQVTEEKRDALFHRLNTIVKLLNEIDPINCPWKTWKEVDSANKGNLDEMSSDQTQHREKIIMPEEILQRIFQMTYDGDKAKRHVSLVVFSRSDGKYKVGNIEGAPPPIIVHTKQEKKEKEKGPGAIDKRINLYEEDQSLTHVDEKYLEGLEGFEHLGLKVLTSNSGSMTKELFIAVAHHIIDNLAADQGIDGKYFFMLLDSHVSRWNPKALYLLMKNRVIPVFFPSHLSIVTQPQDNGVIYYLHSCFEEAAQIARLFETGS